jgi:peptidoglycan/xylan/chitin deacetylase (PgdA/CDA1 family)
MRERCPWAGLPDRSGSDFRVRRADGAAPWPPAGKRFGRRFFLALCGVGILLSKNAVAQESISNRPPAVVILKLDDLRDAGGTFRRVLDFLKARQIKCSVGIIGNSLEGGQEDYFSWIKEQHAGGWLEFWCHGYTHVRTKDADGKEISEFKGESAETQKATLAKCQQLARKKLGFSFRTFGAPFNATDEATLEALKADPEFKVFLYGDPAQAAKVPGMMILDRTPMNIENPIFVPNTARVEHDLNALRATREYFVIQGHPDQWDEERVAEFGKLIDYLCSQNVIFATPSEYFLHKQDPAAHPLPSPAAPGTPIGAKSAPLSENN